MPPSRCTMPISHARSRCADQLGSRRSLGWSSWKTMVFHMGTIQKHGSCLDVLHNCLVCVLHRPTCLHCHKAASWIHLGFGNYRWIGHFYSFLVTLHAECCGKSIEIPHNSRGGSGGRELLFQAGPSNRWPLGLTCEGFLHRLPPGHPT